MKIDFTKSANELVPAVIQDASTKNVLMLGYMNQEALERTQKTKKVTFYTKLRNEISPTSKHSQSKLNS